MNMSEKPKNTILMRVSCYLLLQESYKKIEDKNSKEAQELEIKLEDLMLDMDQFEKDLCKAAK
jgi:hypothetical protein